eukprot:CAMPEP_0194121548 /NCGR_PEP_ID=MMETSP0150-20130528/47450_1 /TAXON_ID=122233 /ORGANISM="Chaetoceros debilis, Strain MM31A-1" /LENGTH=734 /DNA_ID=CAMNT_0038814031 /DNA_START=270 /DNA_END=2471 /DNA_ORIENTATION=-
MSSKTNEVTSDQPQEREIKTRDDCRIFVSGFGPAQSPSSTSSSKRSYDDVNVVLPSEQQLRNIFECYGTIATPIPSKTNSSSSSGGVFVLAYDSEKPKLTKKRKRNPFAFVTFDDADSVKKVMMDYEKYGFIDGRKGIDVISDAEKQVRCNIVKRPNPIIHRHAKRKKISVDEFSEAWKACTLTSMKENDEYKDNRAVANLLLQVNRSHLHRMTEYIEKYINGKYGGNKSDESGKYESKSNPHICDHKYGTLQIVGTLNPSSRPKQAFVFLQTILPSEKHDIAKHNETNTMTKETMDACQYWVEYFTNHPILTRFVLNKAYMVGKLVRVSSGLDERAKANALVTAALAPFTGAKDCDQHDHSEKGGDGNGENSDITLKVQVFPPKPFQQAVVAMLDSKIGEIESTSKGDDDCDGRQISMSATDYTHTFSCIQIFTPQKTKSKSEQGKGSRQEQRQIPQNKIVSVEELYLIGVLPLSRRSQLQVQPMSNEGDKTNDNDDNQEICRAYFKLQEALDYYRYDTSSTYITPMANTASEVSSTIASEDPVTLNFKGMTAFDCGSSPGGWTKYLLDKEQCIHVYSCDPGALDESVLSMDGVQHMRMKGEDAMDWIVEERQKAIQNELVGEGEKLTNDTPTDGSKESMLPFLQPPALVNLWVSDMCLLDPSHQVDHLISAQKKGILANRCFFVLTLKFNTGHAKETFDDMARVDVKRLIETFKLGQVGNSASTAADGGGGN